MEKNDSQFQMYHLTVTTKHNGGRLDKFIVENMPELTRGQVKKLCLGHFIMCDQTIFSDVSCKVKDGQIITVSVPIIESIVPVPQKMDLDIIFEDDHIIIINKPSGLSVHPGAGLDSGTLVNGLLYHTGGKLSDLNSSERPGIVHRLDKETSGVMVVAKTNIAYEGLFSQFFEHTIKRVYYAVTRGCPRASEGRIESFIGRNRHDRKKMAVVGEGGKSAITKWRVLDYIESKHKLILGLIECQLETGRTHQIRVHMASIHHPLIGDPAYGGHDKGLYQFFPKNILQTIKAFPRQALHAGVLGFNHPVTHAYVEFSVPPPQDFQDLCIACGLQNPAEFD